MEQPELLPVAPPECFVAANTGVAPNINNTPTANAASTAPREFEREKDIRNLHDGTSGTSNQATAPSKCSDAHCSRARAYPPPRDRATRTERWVRPALRQQV